MDQASRNDDVFDTFASSASASQSSLGAPTSAQPRGPPAAPRRALYASGCSIATRRAYAPIFSVYDDDAAPFPCVAVAITITAKVPEPDGSPTSFPLLPASVSPGGSPKAIHLTLTGFLPFSASCAE